MLKNESIQWLHTQRVKLHLNNIKTNEWDAEKECKNLQNMLKSAAHNSLRKIMRWNTRKCLKILNDQIKKLIETNKTSYMKWLASMNLEVRIHEETTLAKREVRRSHRVSWDKFITNLKHETYRIQPIVYKTLKQISKYL